MMGGKLAFYCYKLVCESHDLVLLMLDELEMKLVSCFGLYRSRSVREEHA
jgi:hypothetical protein